MLKEALGIEAFNFISLFTAVGNENILIVNLYGKFKNLKLLNA